MDPAERDAIASCQAGRLEEFDPLYLKYVGPIHAYLSRRTLSRDVAEDLTSVTFLKALEGIRSFDPRKGELRGWLYRIARNALIDHYRDPARATAQIETAWDLPGDDFAELRVERAIDAERVRKALSTLTPTQREIVLLRVWDDLPYKEIASVLGKTEANCKMLFSRALRSLRADVAALLILSLFPLQP